MPAVLCRGGGLRRPGGVMGEQGGEGVREVAADAAVVVDEDLAEERVVEQVVLFGLEEAEGDGAGVVGLEQLGAFVVELGEPCLLLAAGQLGVGQAAAEAVADVGAERVDAVVGEPDGGVVVGDLGFDPVDR